MKKLSLAYFGTPYFSARFLEKLFTDTSIKHLIEVKLVVTQANRPVGRKHIMTTSPVKIVAEKFNMPVLDSPPAGGSLEQYFDKTQYKYYSSSKVEKNLNEVDFALVYAYGFKQLIPKQILGMPRLKFGNTNSGFINIHPSLLPKYRGASPIAYPLILGERKTGITLFVIDEMMDHGPIIVQEELEINPTDRRPDLEKKLTDLAFELFKKTLIKLISTDFNRFQPIQQNHKLATHARYLTRDDGFIPFSVLKKAISTKGRLPYGQNNKKLTIEDASRIIKDYYEKNNLTMKQFNNETIYNLFRGLYPWPGLWTIVDIKSQKKRLKITDLTISTKGRSAFGGNNQQLTIKSVQLEGKKEVDFETFEKAYGIFKPFQVK